MTTRRLISILESSIVRAGSSSPLNKTYPDGASEVAVIADLPVTSIGSEARFRLR